MTRKGQPLQTEALFAVPEAEPRAPLREKVWRAIATWTAYRGRHLPCDLCARAVIELGVAAAPAPLPARWRRRGPNDELLLCNPHKLDLKAADDAAEAEAKARRATGVALRKTIMRSRGYGRTDT